MAAASPPRGAKPLSDGERLAALRLIRSPSIGPVTYRELVDHFGSAVAAVEGAPDLAARAGRPLSIRPEADALRELEATLRFGARFIGMDEPDYPPWLRHTDGAPPLLAVKGETTAFAHPAVAIVGSRNASVVGRRFAMTLAEGIGAAGYLVASGLARGIDAAAHEASLKTGTVAVFAGGLDAIYPPENEALAARIVAEGGAHVTEMPLGHQPRSRDFPRRNRIISGIALGTVVIEAADRSGSLYTARRAGDQGRLVFAVPGSPLDPRAAGTNQLIKEGAILVTGVEDVVSALAPMLGRTPPPTRLAEDPAVRDVEPADRERRLVLDALGPSPAHVDEVIRFTGLPARVVQLVILELDLAGRIERHSGQRISLV